jgi:enterochelin esterase-like enzyme
MKAIPTSVLAALLLAAPAALSYGEPDAYLPGPDSKPQPGVPQGELIKFDFSGSKVFPGTTRHVTVYVPRQYDPAKPACVYVDQDGVQFEAPIVLDNLIAHGELPVIIGVFVTPGVVTALDPSKALSRFNRSFEYDGLGDAYSRLILDEVLPVVETKATVDGRPIHLSHSGNDRAIAGSSSGAIAAFTAAWEHPEAFSRVLSAIGTYVGLRGGDRYPALIRKYEPKPIRVFLQDGSGDLNIYGGDWWMANQTMERALVFSGYEVNHEWGDGHHSGKQITSILPDALRWLWKDWPKPVGNGPTQNGALNALLIPGEGWQVESKGADVLGISFGSDGTPFHINALKPRTAPGVSVTLTPSIREKLSKIVFGPSGEQYQSGVLGIMAASTNGNKTTITTLIDGFTVSDFVAAHNGNVYATDPGIAGATSNVWLIRPSGQKQIVDTGLRRAMGITLSPDQSLVYVADGASHWVYSYQIQPDGALADRQRYYWLLTSDDQDESLAGRICCDQAGWLYVATELGVQICDQAGRVNAIIPSPGGAVTSVCFGGKDFAALYATSKGAIFKRKLNATGANPWAAPVVPLAPKL